mgnify:CR=1 FL=1
METYPVALITGSARRIGAAIAKYLHTQKYNVIIHYRNSELEAKDLVAQFNATRSNSAFCIKAELSNYAEMVMMVDGAKAHWGGVDLLVNNASTFYPTPIGKSNLDDWDKIVDSNAKVPFYLSQLLSTELSNRNGSIINMIDIHANAPLAEHTIYCMAKSAVKMMTLSLAKELAPTVRVNGVSPGAILWPSNDVGLTDEVKANLLQEIPLARLGSVIDIAKTVHFLAVSTYITGQIITVDGGRSL